MNINIFLYPLAGVLSLLVLHTFASNELILLASEGSYASALKLAFMGGAGWTVGALATLICSLLGIVRNLFSASSGIGAVISGKLVGIVNSLMTLAALSWNGIIIYLKLFTDNAQAYVYVLGTNVFIEIIICVVLILAFFLKPRKES